PNVFCDFDRGAGKFTEAFGVVPEIPAGSAVDAITLEVAGVINEKIADAVEESAVGDGGKTQTRAGRNGERRHDDGGGFCAAITRENYGDFVAASDESLRKRFDHVGEAARFGKRQAFGCHEKDSHTRFGLRVRYKRGKKASRVGAVLMKLIFLY